MMMTTYEEVWKT